MIRVVVTKWYQNTEPVWMVELLEKNSVVGSLRVAAFTKRGVAMAAARFLRAALKDVAG